MLDKDLLDIKASGYYFKEYNKSQIIQQAAQNRLPLIPISTKSGVINNPVYIGQNDMVTFERIFGTRDKNQERYGNFSYLAAQYVLSLSPAIFINLRSIDSTLDVADSLCLSTDSETSNSGIQSHSLTDYYNTHRFWYVDSAKILRKNDVTDVLQFSNIGNSKVSIFVVKSDVNVAGYNSTVAKYYAAKGEDVPKYLYKEAKMRDYLVDVYMFRSDMTTNPKGNQYYGYLFNDDNTLKKTVINSLGNEVSGLSELYNIVEAETLGKYTGSLIPIAVDSNNVSFSIDTIINADIATHKVNCALNIETIEGASDWDYILESDPLAYPLGGQPLPLDLTGMNLISIDVSGELIDTTKIKKETFLSYDLSAIGLEAQSGYNAKDYSYTTNVVKFEGIRFEGSYVLDGSDHNYTITDKSVIYVGGNMPHVVGDAYWGIDGRSAYVTTSTYVGVERVLTLLIHSSELPIQGDNTAFPQNTEGVFVYPIGHANAGEPVEYDGVTGYPLDGVGGTVIPYPTFVGGELAQLYTDFGTDRNIYKCVLSKELYVDGYSGTVTKVAVDPQMTITYTNATTQLVFSDDTVSAYHIPEPKNLASSYKAYTLSSYIPRNAQFCDGTSERQDEILDVLLSEGILKGLKNKDLVDYRYIVDAFKTFLVPNSKRQFGKVSEQQGLSLSIINEPFSDDIINSTDPYFTDVVNGDYKVEYYGTGGNTSLPYTTLYSKPSDDYGNSWCASFQCLLRTENRRRTSFISAPIIVPLFIRKLRESVASDAIMGTTYAINATNITDADIVYDNDDRGYLEPFGMNPIVKKDGILQVTNNTTCSYVTTSAMSSIHNRETVIDIRRELIPLLNSMVGKDNTANFRSRSKREVDAIFEKYKNNGSIFKYINIIDDTNNDGEVIENGYSIIDSHIWFTPKTLKVVHRATYHSQTNDVQFNIEG